MFFDFFLIAVRNLRARGTRTWLTMIGIFIGVAAIVALVSLGQGLQVAIGEEFEKMGIDKIILTPGSGGALGTPMGSAANLFTDQDMNAVRNTRGVDEVGGMIMTIAGVSVGEKIRYGYVAGIPTDESKKVIESMQSVEIIEGRGLKSGDKYKAVVGREFYDGNRYDEKVKVGEKLYILNNTFRVVGLFGPIGNPDDDATVWIPLETAQELLGKEHVVDVAIAQVHENVDVAEAAERIKKSLRKSRGVKEDQEDFSVSTSEELLESFGVVLDAVSFVFIGIAAISLIVGGIGIMNTMYTQVMERTTEIGVMKAIGARNKDILLIFLIESGMLGLAGGAIGIGIGVALSKGVEKIMVITMGVEYIKAYFPWQLVVGTLAFAFFVGAFSGVLPAIGASKLKPVDALRWE